MRALLTLSRALLLLALSAALHLAAALALLPRAEPAPIRLDLSRLDLRVVTRLSGTGSGDAPGVAGGGSPVASPAPPSVDPQAAIDAGLAALERARDLLVDWSAEAAAAFEPSPVPPAAVEPAKEHVKRPRVRRGGSTPAPPLGPAAPDPDHLSRPSLSPPPRRKGRAERDPGGLEGRGPSSGVRGGAPVSSSAGPPGGGGRGGGSDVGAVARAVTAAIRRRLVYPESARRGGVRGRVTVAFRLDPSGAIGGAAVAEGSGSPDLDAAVLAALRAASPVHLPFRPCAALDLTLPVAFELRGR